MAVVSCYRSRRMGPIDTNTSRSFSRRLGRMSFLRRAEIARDIHSMNFKKEYTVPEHLRDGQGLPRNREERLLWIKQKVEEGYYDSERIMEAVAEAFLEPYEVRRAGDKSWRGGGGDRS